jgi:sugar-phosphatase
MSERRVLVDAVLFDLDGVLVDSVAIAEAAWRAWAARHGLDASAVLSHIHGTRPIETIRTWLPAADAAEEADWLVAYELDRLDACRPAAGAIELVESLPTGRWGVVTSADRLLAQARLTLLQPHEPAVLVSSSDVARGKPEPDPYRRAASVMGLADHRWLGIEDSNSGLQSVRGAGGIPCGLMSSYGREDLPDAELLLESLLDVRVGRGSPDGEVELRLARPPPN